MTTSKISRALYAAAAATLIALATGCSAPAATHVAEAAAKSETRHKAAQAEETPAAGAGVASAAPAANNTVSTVKQVHSPGAVAIDEQLSPGQCAAKDVDAAAGLILPDTNCTPGAVDTAVSQENIGSTICAAGGYTSTVRPPAAETDKFKATALRAYGQAANKTTELDHLVSLELGGTNSATNLWPEANKSGATGTTNPKDAVEDALHKAVCNRTVKLADAQNAIARNWTTALKDLGL